MSWSARVASSIAGVIEFLRGLHSNRWLLLQLTRRDLVAAYSGAVAGNLWLIVDPIVYVALTVVFFQFAIKGAETAGVPYVAWVLPAIILWTFINAVLGSSVGAVREYGYLLRHRTFDMRLVAFIKAFSAGWVHVLLMVVLLVVLTVFLGVRPSVRWPWLFYYFFAMYSLLIGMSWLISALGVFWKDVRNLVSVFLQVEFWFSPIFWEPERFPRPVAMLMYLNPFYYPIHGYRQTILAADLDPHFVAMTLYFWALVVGLGWFASRVFARLSRSFGDAL